MLITLTRKAAVISAVALVLAGAGCSRDASSGRPLPGGAGPGAGPTTGPAASGPATAGPAGTPGPGAPSGGAAAGGGAYAGRDDLCDRVDLATARAIVESVQVSDRRRQKGATGGDAIGCTYGGAAGTTAETLIVLSFSVEARVFAAPSGAEESFRDLGADDLLRCQPTPQNVSALGTRAVEASCPASRGGGDYFVSVLDGNLHLYASATARNLYNAVDHAEVRAMLQALARSALAALRT